jgi:hypothetical protein
LAPFASLTAWDPFHKSLAVHRKYNNIIIPTDNLNCPPKGQLAYGENYKKKNADLTVTS